MLALRGRPAVTREQPALFPRRPWAAVSRTSPRPSSPQLPSARPPSPGLPPSTGPTAPAQRRTLGRDLSPAPHPACTAVTRAGGAVTGRTTRQHESPTLQLRPGRGLQVWGRDSGGSKGHGLWGPIAGPGPLGVGAPACDGPAQAEPLPVCPTWSLACPHSPQMSTSHLPGPAPGGPPTIHPGGSGCDGTPSAPAGTPCSSCLRLQDGRYAVEQPRGNVTGHGDRRARPQHQVCPRRGPADGPRWTQRVDWAWGGAQHSDTDGGPLGPGVPRGPPCSAMKGGASSGTF